MFTSLTLGFPILALLLLRLVLKFGFREPRDWILPTECGPTKLLSSKLLVSTEYPHFLRFTLGLSILFYMCFSTLEE